MMEELALMVGNATYHIAESSYHIPETVRHKTY